jgi:hypothetical protein
MDEYLDSPMDTLDNDEVFPCKGCGEVCAESMLCSDEGNGFLGRSVRSCE